MKLVGKHIIRIIILFCLLAALTNCTRYKNIVYVQDRYELSGVDSIPSASSNVEEIVLVSGDNIYIDVYGIDMSQMYMFDKNSDQRSANYTNTSLYLQGYILDKKGDVEMPVVGKVNVAGLTISEAREKLQAVFSEYLKGVVVDVKLLSYHVTLLGEFASPGTHTFYKRDVNLLDAIGEAGDISVYGDRRSVLVMRRIGNSTKTVELDLTKSEFYSSQYFWLKPNDVVYVKPLRSKSMKLNIASLSLLLTSLTTLIVILTYIEK